MQLQYMYNFKAIDLINKKIVEAFHTSLFKPIDFTKRQNKNHKILNYTIAHNFLNLRKVRALKSFF